ncbi:MAG: DUF3038 domain-containing protein [Prochloraceae cyanobacterium]|nr:DUF3038 domain-containing protein [Prochloraceae cyanobacterium]
MSHYINVMPDSSSASLSKEDIVKDLPDIPISKGVCSPQIQQKIDLLLLAIEALELGGSEYMLELAKELGLRSLIKNRVVLWRLRCSNPWRRSYTRNNLTFEEAKALVTIASKMAQRLTVSIRELLLAEQHIRSKGLALEQHFRLSDYLERFRAHFKSRMNPRRAKIDSYLSSKELLDDLAISLLSQLLFCTGTSGKQRLWHSLFDGEVK